MDPSDCPPSPPLPWHQVTRGSRRSFRARPSMWANAPYPRPTTTRTSVSMATGTTRRPCLPTTHAPHRRASPSTGSRSQTVTSAAARRPSSPIATQSATITAPAAARARAPAAPWTTRQRVPRRAPGSRVVGTAPGVVRLVPAALRAVGSRPTKPRTPPHPTPPAAFSSGRLTPTQPARSNAPETTRSITTTRPANLRCPTPPPAAAPSPRASLTRPPPTAPPSLGASPPPRRH